MLQIGVDRDHGATPRRAHACEQRVLVAEVARKTHASDPVVVSVQPGYGFPAGVVAAVVDEDELALESRGLDRRQKPLIELRNGPRFV